MTTRAGLLDTSVFIAAETGRELRRDLFPDELAVSVVTIAELRAGVLAGRDTATRARRMSTLERATRLNPLPIDVAAADIWAELRVRLAEARRRVNVNDLWIASVALAHDLPVVTQDGDFDPLTEVSDLRVVSV